MQILESGIACSLAYVLSDPAKPDENLPSRKVWFAHKVYYMLSQELQDTGLTEQRGRAPHCDMSAPIRMPLAVMSRLGLAKKTGRRVESWWLANSRGRWKRQITTRLPEVPP
jgi:hypothetical protein